MINHLPEDSLEDIFLRLSYGDVVHGKQVCRKWKRLMDSSSFRRAYRDSVKWTCYKYVYQKCPEVYKLVDSSNNTLRWRGAVNSFNGAGGITSKIHGLMIGRNYGWGCDDETFTICNIFTNKLQQIPDNKFSATETAIFDLGGGQYKLVNWTHSGELRTLENGQLKWSEVTKTSGLTCSNLLVVGNSIFRVDYKVGNLMEYNIILGRLTTKPIRSKVGETRFQWRGDIGNAVLMISEGQLYLVVSYDAGDTFQTVELRRLSEFDGLATLVVKFEMQEPLDHFDSVQVTGEGTLLHIAGDMNNLSAVSIIYNMSTRTMQDRTVSRSSISSIKTIVVPVRLYD